MAANPQSAPRTKRLEYLRNYHQNRRSYAPLEDRQMLLGNPMLKPNVCRLCWWESSVLKDQHFLLEHRDELGNGMTDITAKKLSVEYRRRFGFNARARLVSEDLRNRQSKNLKGRNSRRRHQGRSVFGQRTRFKRGQGRKGTYHPGVEARKASGTSLETKQRMSAAHLGIPRPDLRKEGSPGDWQLARLRLAGKTAEEIAEKIGLDRATVQERLRMIGFPAGPACQFYRGEPITEKQLRAHYGDLVLLRIARPIEFPAERQYGNGDGQLTLTQVAQMLHKSKQWVYTRTRDSSKDKIPHSCIGSRLLFDFQQVIAWRLSTRHNKDSQIRGVEEELAQRVGLSRIRIYQFVSWKNFTRRSEYPLSWDVAGRLLASITSLRHEYRRQGSSAKGGRPKALLPSEEKELPAKYQALKADLDLMLTWAEREEGIITLDVLGEWMCRQSRREELQRLLFWPSIHDRLPPMCEQARNRMHGRLGPAERAKDILSEQYKISRPALERLIVAKASNPAAIPPLVHQNPQIPMDSRPL